MLEFRVAPDVDSVLVTSTRGLLWVTPRDGRIRAASRSLDNSTFFAEVVRMVALTGRGAEWGNVVPYTDAGFQAGRAHLAYYDISAVELLLPPHADVRGWDTGDVPVREAPWLPEGWAVLVPIDREYVGMLMLALGGKGFAVVHNAARGIVVLTDGSGVDSCDPA